MKLCYSCARPISEDDVFCPECGVEVELSKQPKEAYHIVPGTLLNGRYIMGLALGYGGFGVTYAAYDTVLCRRVAIKEYLPSEFATRAPGTVSISVFGGEENETLFIKGIQSFIDEAVRLAKFNESEGIVHVFDSFSENNTAYMVMEFLEGRTLQAILDEKGKLPYAEASDIMIRVLDSLEEVHKDGIIHRDISPDNIFVTNDGRVKLLDFGAARYATANVSKSLSVILKPGYAPTEQYMSRSDQGSWSDVYAAGATLYRAITGIIPDESLERAVKDTLKPPSKLGAKLPKNAETAILNALNIDAESRTRTASEFRDQLISGLPVARLRDRKGGRAGALPKWVYYALAGVLALGAVFAGLIIGGVIKTSKASLDVSLSGLSAVPNLIGITEEEAAELYPDWQLRTVGNKTTDEVAEGCIMEQTPTFGSMVSAGSAINITVNRGVTTEADVMALLRGSSLDDALDILKDYETETVWEYDDMVIYGSVTGTDPERGSRLEPGQHVTVYVSLGGTLKGAEILYDGDSITLNEGEGPVEISCKITPANIREEYLTVEWSSDDASVVECSDGKLVPRSMGDTTIRLRVSMIDEERGIDIAYEDSLNVKVAAKTAANGSSETEASTEPKNTPKPADTPKPRETNTPKPRETNTPKPRETNTPKPRETNTPTPTPTKTPKTATPTPKPTNTPAPQNVSFSDPTFEKAFRKAMGYSDSQKITTDMILEVTELDLSGEGLQDISDIAKFKNIKKLLLDYNPISDVSPLEGLSKLRTLHLNFCAVTDVAPLAKLTGLTSLHLSMNGLSNISKLSSLKKLKWLLIGYNNIEDISALSGMSQLMNLQITGNRVRDITPLKKLTKMQYLFMEYNDIDDVTPLKGLSLLELLGLTGNPLDQDQVDELKACLPNCEIDF